MSKSKKREIGDMVVFDVTAGGYILPGELKEQLGGRTFLRWVQHDGERAKVIETKPASCDIVFDDGYVIRGVPLGYFKKDETLVFGTAPKEGVPSTTLEESMDKQMDVLEEERDAEEVT